MIALDAMGGDFAPEAIVTGAFYAARKKIPVILYGDEKKMTEILQRLDAAWWRLPLSLVHCSEIIAMDDEPGKSVVRKKDSSLVRAVQAVDQGSAEAIISAGNSGAGLVAGMLLLGKIPGITRPAIGGFLPTFSDSVFCIDLGANVECKPEYLYQFALMGDAYVRLTKNIEKPRIGLLANGTEIGKGTSLIQQAYTLLAQSSLHFVGNCEPMDVLHDKADVIVCEGFSGNIMLKSMEATVKIVTQWLKNEGAKSLLGRCAGLLAAPVFQRLKKNIKKAQRGGALLLGVTKPLIIAHGASDAHTIEDAIVFAEQVVAQKIHARFNEMMNTLQPTLSVVTQKNSAQTLL